MERLPTAGMWLNDFKLKAGRIGTPLGSIEKLLRAMLENSMRFGCRACAAVNAISLILRLLVVFPSWHSINRMNRLRPTHNQRATVATNPSRTIWPERLHQIEPTPQSISKSPWSRIFGTAELVNQAEGSK